MILGGLRAGIRFGTKRSTWQAEAYPTGGGEGAGPVDRFGRGAIGIQEPPFAGDAGGTPLHPQ
jgi:hypothetical protein